MTDGPGPSSTPSATAAERDRAADLAALREALDGLRDEIETRLVRPSGGGALGFDPMQLYDRVRDALRTLGMREWKAEVDDFGFDVDVVDVARPLLDFLYERYWRVDAIDVEDVPVDRPPLFAANRGGLLPWDGLMIAHAVTRAFEQIERPRFLVADWLVTLPFAQPVLMRFGGVRACPENALRLLRTGRPVVAFPEGAKGAAKAFRHRYRVQRFGRGGVVRTALVTGAPLVPVAVVGNEETHPVLFRLGAVARAVGLPFLPVTPTFPWLGPLGLLPLPSKWRIRFGEPLDTAGLPREAADDDLLIWRLNEELRARVQQMVDEELAARDSVWG